MQKIISEAHHIHLNNFMCDYKSNAENSRKTRNKRERQKKGP